MSMNARDFMYWMRGAFEMGGLEKGITSSKAELIKKHLDLAIAEEARIAHLDHQSQAAEAELITAEARKERGWEPPFHGHAPAGC